MRNAFDFKFNAWVNGSGKPRMIKWKDIDAIEWCNDKLWHHSGEYTLLGNLILLTFTGLKDSKGKEIYEGDYMDTEDGLMEVYFIEGKFVIMWADNGTYRNDLCEINKTLEVCGNKFENKK